MTAREFLIIALIVAPLAICSCRNGNSNKKGKPDQDNKELIETPLVFSVTIHDAALSGDLSQVSMILGAGIKPDTLDNEKRTALMYAAYIGNCEIMKALISKGANVNLTDNNGSTALIMASSGPYAEAVKLLLDNGADPDIADSKEHFTALMYAASEGQMEVVKLLLSRQANPGLKDIDGDDAETFARQNGHPDIASVIKSLKEKY